MLGNPPGASNNITKPLGWAINRYKSNRMRLGRKFGAPDAVKHNADTLIFGIVSVLRSNKLHILNDIARLFYGRVLGAVVNGE